MIGIYAIRNSINGKMYIGQSRDIFKRWQQHIYHRYGENISNIDNDINVFGLCNFEFIILELCKQEELDMKEDYYIRYYGTCINGYNQVYGGQNNIGESNSNAKLTAQDVYDIRELYNKHVNPSEVYEYYKDKISISYFFNLWEGKSWCNIHMDVYTEENKSFYKNSFLKRNYNEYRFTDKEVKMYRYRYMNETAEEIYNSIRIDATFSSFKSMLTGQTYKHLPIYCKKKKEWINIIKPVTTISVKESTITSGT